MAYTLGPWECVGASFDDVPDRSAAYILRCVDSRMFPASKGNANLIAAAPDLLEACEAFVNAFEDDQNYFGVEFAKGKAAIAKAIGNARS